MAVRAALLEDLALARSLAARGHDVRFLDATAVLDAAGYGSPAGALDRFRDGTRCRSGGTPSTSRSCVEHWYSEELFARFEPVAWATT